MQSAEPLQSICIAVEIHFLLASIKGRQPVGADKLPAVVIEGNAVSSAKLAHVKDACRQRCQFPGFLSAYSRLIVST